MAKSSKKAAKRALKQRQAIYASITRSRNRGIVITNKDSSSRSVNPNTQDTPNTQVTQESNCETKKKTRGVTRMKNEAKEKGKDPEKITRVDVWIEGHKRKKNKPLSEAVQTTMDEINQLRESTCPPNDNNINEDSLVKVLGAEKRGRVRGLEFGATSSRVQTQIQSGGRIKQLEAELKATNDQVASLKDMIMKQNDQLLNRGVQMEDAVGSHVYTPPHVFTLQSQHGSIPMTQDMSKFENARWHLLHWYPEDDSEDQIVAEDRISSTNSKDKIHNMPLGKGYWRVWIDAVSIDIKVCRSTDEYEMLSQAVGSSVA
ncbi:hypothetical protein ACOSQ4_017887 [Xanthoceras sorbifolium]